jgi:DNA-binding XRE family transcriptional regulator
MSEYTWDNGNLVWLFRELSALYEAAGEAKIAVRMDRIAADLTGMWSPTIPPRELAQHREQLRRDVEKGPHVFLRILADVLDWHSHRETADDLRSLQKRLALDAAKHEGGEAVVMPRDETGTLEAIALVRRTVGQTLRAARERAGLTHAELAREIGEKPSLVIAAEQGKASVSAQYAPTVLRACGLSKDWKPRKPGE